MLKDYIKDWKSPEDLIVFLTNKGANFEHKEIKILIENIGYFRLKSYLYYFIKSDKIPEETSLSSIKNLYYLDKDLRFFIFSLIASLEIQIRTFINEQITKTKNKHWYLDKTIYKDLTLFTNLINKIKGNLEKSKDPILEYFYKTYNPETIPSWMFFDMLTFGDLCNFLQNIHFNKLYKNTEPVNFYKFNKLIKTKFKIDIFTLINWLYAIRDIRNSCCHHSRIIGKNCRGIKSIKSFYKDPKKFNSLKANNVYNVLVALNILLLSFDNKIEIGSSIEKLFIKYDTSASLQEALGFFPTWKEEILYLSPHSSSMIIL